MISFVSDEDTQSLTSCNWHVIVWLLGVIVVLLFMGFCLTKAFGMVDHKILLLKLSLLVVTESYFVLGSWVSCGETDALIVVLRESFAMGYHKAWCLVHCFLSTLTFFLCFSLVFANYFWMIWRYIFLLVGTRFLKRLVSYQGANMTLTWYMMLPSIGVCLRVLTSVLCWGLRELWLAGLIRVRLLTIMLMACNWRLLMLTNIWDYGGPLPWISQTYDRVGHAGVHSDFWDRRLF